MEATRKSGEWSMMEEISGVMRSTPSLVMRMGLEEDLMASVMAMQVAEFLERSPARKVKSGVVKKLVSSGEVAKEPELVAGAK